MGVFDMSLTEVVDWQLTETVSVVRSRMQRPVSCILRKTKHERFMVIF